ncbi:MAG TPA: M28 family peptidase [Terriglobales bacterium]|nr:M28 family peptidase [Terriglobales bacterium]
MLPGPTHPAAPLRFLSRGILFVLLAGIFATSSLAAVPNANPNRYLEDVKTLSAPNMEGRGDGTRGLTRAANYIAHQFKTLRLQPAGTNGYLQPFTVTTGAKLKKDNHLRFEENGATKSLKLNEDYVPLSFSSVGSFKGEVVFAGYGASADEFQYDDYAHLDVKDKIVIVLRYEPDSFAEKSGHHGLTQHSHLITKAINARNHGAKAVILVNGKLGDGEEDLLMRFGSQAGPRDAGILLVQVKNSVADGWFKAAGKSLAEVQRKINSEGKPQSFAFSDSLQLSLKVDIESVRATVSNVLAYLPGKTGEYVIVGAHYDHLGRGGPDSLAPSMTGTIHPGADDNASGTAGMLELARLFAQRPAADRLERGILFMAFAGEELGLLGSEDWVKQPTLPLNRAVAMLNMDMIGRIRENKIYIGGVGTGSTFKPLLEEAASKYDFNVEYSAGGYAASDHTSFVAKDIPVLFFFSGLHSDYHKPSDTWDRIDPNAAAKLLDLIEQVTTDLANAQERPKYVRVDELAPVAGQAGGGTGYGPYFGSIPDFGETEKGVKFSDVKPGSPAAKAGLKGGDVLIQFNEKPINNLYDFTDALRRSKVGDVVDVIVMRDGKPLNAKVKLEQRR